MNVLHIVWNLIRGGTEGQCARIAMALKHRVAVSKREGFFLEQVESTCGPVYEMKITRIIGFDTLREVRRLARFIRDEKIELVHAWDADAAIFGMCAAGIAGVPYITSRRDLGQIYSEHKAWLMGKADENARAIVVNAGAIKQHLFGGTALASRVHNIPNVLDVDEFDRLSARNFRDEDDLPTGRRFVMVSRLDPEKDATTFIRAAARIRAPDVSFVIAGDGGERQTLENLAGDLKLGRRMIFLGDVKDVPALLRQCQVGVLVPKSNEGLSNSILEYMAAGLPVIATDCGGNRELVKDGVTGFVVAPGNATQLADAMNRVLAGDSSSMGREGRKIVEQRHRPEIVAAQFEKLYRDVVAK